MLRNHTDYSKFTDDELEASLKNVEVEIKEIGNQKKQIVETILNRKRDLIENLLSVKEEPFGTVNVDNFEITVGKKVVWDQKMLAQLAQQIMTAVIAIFDGVRKSLYSFWFLLVL